MQRTPLFNLLIVVLFFIPNLLSATTYTFTGSGDWSNSARWDGNGIPPNPLAAADIILIHGVATLGTSITINGKLTISLNNSSLSIESGGNMQNNGTVEELNYYNSSMIINNGGIFSNSGIYTNYQLLQINNGGTMTNSATMNANNNVELNEGSSFTNTGTFAFSGTLYLNKTQSNLPGGNFVFYNSWIIVAASCTLTISTPTIIPEGATMLAYGRVINNSTLTIMKELLIESTGSFSNLNGTLNLVSGSFLKYSNTGATPPDGTFNWNAGSTMSVYNFGTMVLNQPLTIGSGSILQILGTLTNNSTLTNNGIIKSFHCCYFTPVFVQSGTFTNTGSIAPGASPGKLTVNGDLTLGTGTYNSEINGTGQGTTYDWLNVTGNMNLTGSKLVVNWGGFTPSIGNNFSIITCGTLTGEFSTVTIPPVSGMMFSVVYSTNEVYISAIALPVELINFAGKETKQGNQLEWETASEINNRGFEVFHSKDGVKWTKLEFIQGHGTSLITQHYRFLDKSGSLGMNYYRLNQVDFDGHSEFSRIITVIKSDGDRGIILFPNPASDVIEFTLPGNLSGIGELKIFSLLGILVKSIKFEMNSGNEAYKFDVKHLISGSYFVEINSENIHKVSILYVE